MANIDILDRISPTYIGEDKITLAVDQTSLPLSTATAITITFDYTQTGTTGVVLPLVLQVQPMFGDGTGYIRKVFNRTVPNRYTFRLTSAGQWLVVLKEYSHNQWQGRLIINVGGEQFSQIITDRS